MSSVTISHESSRKQDMHATYLEKIQVEHLRQLRLGRTAAREEAQDLVDAHGVNDRQHVAI